MKVFVLLPLAILSALVVLVGCSSSSNGTGPSNNSSSNIAAEVVAVWFDVSAGFGLDIKADGAATALARSGGLIIVSPSGTTFSFTSFKNGAWTGTKKVGSTMTDVSGTYSITSGKITVYGLTDS